ncbi:MAG TPA: phospho-N-acetylmuramoyl-pentapeptide-transferase [Clostridiaceae bacterium]|nr:phospho-N-acetylmuramoyl-pentapeptide-transferase [Clostridiaceae bacterium]
MERNTLNTAFTISTQTIAFAVTFLLTLISGPIFIPILTKLKVGQTVRDDGPATHLKKTGTPTMGGIIFLLPLLLVSLYYAVEYPEILVLTFTTLGFGLIGFIDDFIKVVKRRKDGLYWNQKMLGLIIVSAVSTFYIVYVMKLGTDIIIPFLGFDYTISLPVWFFIPLCIFVLISSTNAVNMTDGIDGLAAGVTLIVMVFFAIVAMTRSEWDYVKMFSSAIAGGCLGFLAFNMHPARLFMGDNGSLALGGAVGIISIVMKMPWILLVVGFIYVIETLSVMIQVASFKTRGKRVFKMAPLHHHFELSGWKETKVVTVFWIVTVVACFIGFITLRFRIF